MGNITYRLNRFAFYDRERIQKYLEAMAQKGWMLDQTGATLWRYRKESPRKIHVFILYVADGSTYNSYGDCLYPVADQNHEEIRRESKNQPSGRNYCQ